ncbi:PKD-like family lipoprotein [Pedobacter nyackensis]|uniref:PKD-like family lipoprotein n=1 Tax=Pedobacter nyackensis TaxID=475255 RepID=UPI00292F506E|nr:PKD-like family lipoprotein [Pedobacter nyackensis]
MKKQIILLLGITISFLVMSCYKDKGNYEYTPNEVITAKGIEPAYTVLFNSNFKINPVVSSSKAEAKFEYFWAIYNKGGAQLPADTIGRTLNLDYVVTKNPGSYVLVFGAKNIATGFQQQFTYPISIDTEFTRGWYILKDNGAKTDLDLYLTPTSLVPSSQLNNVFSSINGKQVEGKARYLSFSAEYQSTVNGSPEYPLAATRVLFMTTDKGASVLNVNTLLEIHDFDGMFQGPAPVVKSPTFIGPGTSSYLFVNAGQLHALQSNVANLGLFNIAQQRNTTNDSYHLSKYFFSHAFGGQYFFDETSSSFVSTSGASSMLVSVVDAPGTLLSANKNNQSLLYMGVKSNTEGVALFQDKTTSVKRLGVFTVSTAVFKVTSLVPILNTEKLNDATLITSNVNDESLIYFVVGGNQLWSRNLVSNVEQLQYIAPVGETITYIRHKVYNGFGEESAYSFNYILVGSSLGGNYKVRMFGKTAGNLNATPVMTLNGSGNIGDIIYTSPSLFTYLYNSY